MSQELNVKKILLDLASDLVEAADDADKFDRGQDAAGKRLRKLCQDAKAQLQELRTSIQTIRLSRKTK